MRSDACALVVFSAIFGHSGVAAEVDDPFADRVIDVDFGAGGAPGYDNPFTVLGSPERFTGEGIFPGVVSAFNPAFGMDEIISLGMGGFITVLFDTPVRNDPANPFGIDLLVFGNTGFIDADFPNGIVGGLFGNDGGAVEVSADGNNWFLIDGVAADGMFPTIGYLDSGPYDQRPGNRPTDFTLPVNPSLTFDDFNGLTYQRVLDLYAGSGGGTGIDIGAVGLDEISFVRISYGGSNNIEIDAFVDVAAVPAPGALALLTAGLAIRSRKRRV